jgi:hypothetical protein
MGPETAVSDRRGPGNWSAGGDWSGGRSQPHAVRRFLQLLVQRLGVSVIVSYDLFSFRQVGEKLGLEQQVCQFHVRRWVGGMLHDLRQTAPKEWLWGLEEIKHLFAELPLEGSRRLFELWKQVPERRMGQAGERSPLDLLHSLLIRLSEQW